MKPMNTAAVCVAKLSFVTVSLHGGCKLFIVTIGPNVRIRLLEISLPNIHWYQLRARMELTY